MLQSPSKTIDRNERANPKGPHDKKKPNAPHIINRKPRRHLPFDVSKKAAIVKLMWKVNEIIRSHLGVGLSHTMKKV